MNETLEITVTTEALVEGLDKLNLGLVLNKEGLIRPDNAPVDHRYPRDKYERVFPVAKAYFNPDSEGTIVYKLRPMNGNATNQSPTRYRRRQIQNFIGDNYHPQLFDMYQGLEAVEPA